MRGMLGRRILLLLFLMPFSLFIGTTTYVTIQGVHVYHSIVNGINERMGIETPLAYINTKIKQIDNSQGVKITHKEGIQVLVLTQEIEGDTYETWIYAYQGHLYEMLMMKGMDFELSEGIPVLEIESLRMAFLNPHTLEIAIVIHRGNTYTRIIGIRSHSIN